MAHDGVNALVGNVTLLDAQVKRVAVDRDAIGERHHFAIDKHCTADGPESFPIVEHLANGFPFHYLAVGALEMADGLGIVAPLLQQLQALGEEAGLQRAVLVIRIKSGKLI